MEVQIQHANKAPKSLNEAKPVLMQRPRLGKEVRGPQASCERPRGSCWEWGRDLDLGRGPRLVNIGDGEEWETRPGAAWGGRRGEGTSGLCSSCLLNLGCPPTPQLSLLTTPNSLLRLSSLLGHKFHMGSNRPSRPRSREGRWPPFKKALPGHSRVGSASGVRHCVTSKAQSHTKSCLPPGQRLGGDSRQGGPLTLRPQLLGAGSNREDDQCLAALGPSSPTS